MQIPRRKVKTVTKESKALLIKYAVCFAAASLITLAVFWAKGFFTEDVAVNIQILSDGFFVSGILMTMLGGMIFISDEGGLLGIGFVLRNVVMAFIPMGRKNHEFYAQYRERKMKEKKERKERATGNNAILFTGLLFLFVGIIFTVIWYSSYYNSPVYAGIAVVGI